ncbi:hypothetical protein CMI37_05105 [Candidatus Pacearchaeota archaeon]|nr:hypothetical protein [Candidatus Pacearchaeota archaeon]|tara:strand:- start:1103 stop:1459 length:357 start_codon:yes stop_codon:yes gene_type:complete
MPKYIKATYCKNCGSSNEPSFKKGSSLMEKPKLCSSCGYDLSTGKKPKKKKEKKKIEAEIEEPTEKPIPISIDIPPLELEEEGCYFGNKIVSTLGNLVSPTPKETPESSENASQKENQ